MVGKLALALTAALSTTDAFGAGSVVFDNTLPNQAHGTTTVVPLTGGHYSINAANTGYLTGKNLFESFATFNIASGEEADFTNSTNLSINNVISRVTGIGSPDGLQPTTINGTLKSTIAGANFWFINPAGITIGAGGTINVPAGLALGRADYIQFSDSSRWYAIDSKAPTPSVLSTASPTSFGFLTGIAPAAVDSPSANSYSGQASVTAGGRVTLQSVAVDTGYAASPIAISGASVEIDQGLINTGSSSNTGGGLNVSGTSGSVILNGTVATTSGNVSIVGNGVLISGQSLISENSGNPDFSVTVQSTGTVAESNPQSILNQATSGVVRIVDSAIAAPYGDGGIVIGSAVSQQAQTPGGNSTDAVVIAGSVIYGQNIGINASQGVWIEGSNPGYPLIVQTFQEGNIIDTRTSATQSLVSVESLLSVPTSTLVAIQAGNQGVTLDHSIVDLSGNATITTVGGPITLVDSLLTSGSTSTGTIELKTLPTPGSGSSVTEPVISLTNTQIASSQFFNGYGEGSGPPAGSIIISSAGDVSMSAGSSLATNSNIDGSGGGLIQVIAGGSLSTQNSSMTAVDASYPATGGGISLSAMKAVSMTNTVVDVSTTAGAAGGAISIVAPEIALVGDSVSAVATLSAPIVQAVYDVNFVVGNAGTIVISASGSDPQGAAALQISGTALQSSASAPFLGQPIVGGAIVLAGNAGDVDLIASKGSISLGNLPGVGPTSITTSANAYAGQAGKISVVAADNVTVQDVAFDTSVATNYAAGLVPGQISLASTNGKIALLSSTLTASTSGAVAAGGITISAPTVSIDGGKIAASTTGTGNAGNIALTASGVDPASALALQITGGAQIVSATGTGAGVSANAGTVSLSASAGTVGIGSLADTSSTVVSTSAGADAGAAGAVTVSGAAISLGNADVSTTTAQGPAQGVKPGSIALMTSGDGPISVVNSALSASTSGVQQAGAINLDGGAVTLSNSSIFSSTNSSASAGDITIAGKTVSITASEAGQDISVSTTGTGPAGNITISASGPDPAGGVALQIAGITVGSTATGTPMNRAGNAGTVSISAANGSIALGTEAAGSPATEVQSSANFAGQAGTVKLSAGQNLTVDEASVDTSVGTILNNQSFAPGEITLSAGGTISLLQSTLSASTSGDLAAGTISVIAPAVAVNGGSITASTTGAGSAGDVVLTATGADPQAGVALQVIGGASISSDASAGTSSAANAGKVALSASNGTVQLGLSTDSNPTLVSTSAGPNAGAPGAITVSGTGIVLGEANLTTIAAGSGVDTKSGTISLTANNGTGPLTVLDSTLSANSRGISQAGEIDLSGGQILLSNAALTSGTTAAGGAGAINILGSTISLSGGQVSVATTGTGNAGDITVQASGPNPQGGAALQIAGTSVQSTAAGVSASPSGSAGAITLEATAGSVALGSAAAGAMATQIQTSANAFSGQAGAIKIGSEQGITANNTVIDTSVATATSNSLFAPGEISLTTPGAVSLIGSTLQATTAGSVAAGDINVAAGGALQISSGPQAGSAFVLSSSTSTAGSAGAAGKISLSGTAVTLDDANIAATILGGSGLTGPANIVLTASGPIVATDGSTINANTSGAAPGGSIQLMTPAAVTIMGVGTAISSNTAGDGAGGDIEFGAVPVPQQGVFGAPIATLMVSGGANISVNSSGSDASAGKGGAMSIFATGPVSLSGTDTGLSSQSSSAALGGSINLSASSLSLTDGAVITADTSSSPVSVSAAGAQHGRHAAASAPAATVTGGSVAVNTVGAISLAGQGTAITANASGAGSGGTVDLTADTLQMSSGAQVATRAFATGNSGTITVNLKPAVSASGALELVPIQLSNSLITTTAVSSTGGNVQINADGSPVTLHNSGIETSAGAGGNGGDITIDDAGRTILQASAILAEAVHGNGGAIFINLAPGALFVADSRSQVSAQSATGVSGTVTISTPPSDLNSALTIPDVSVARALELTANVCNRDHSRSTFLREGRGGIAADPDGYLSVPTAGDSVPETSASTRSATRLLAELNVGCL